MHYWKGQECLLMAHFGEFTLREFLAKSEEYLGLTNMKYYLVLQIVQALTYMHGLDPPFCSVYLDMGKIMVSSNLSLKLLPTMLVMHGQAVLDDQLRHLRYTERLRYAPPELIRGSQFRSATIQGDIWSIGCIILQIFGEDVPWAANTLREVRSRLQNCHYVPIPKKIPLGMQKLICNCCNYNPKQRPKAAEILMQIEDEYKELVHRAEEMAEVE